MVGHEARVVDGRAHARDHVEQVDARVCVSLPVILNRRGETKLVGWVFGGVGWVGLVGLVGLGGLLVRWFVGTLVGLQS